LYTHLSRVERLARDQHYPSKPTPTPIDRGHDCIPKHHSLPQNVKAASTLYIYTKLIRLDIYLKRTSGVLVIVRSFLLPKGSPDSKTDEYSVRAMLFIDALASVSS
jgi:hypothetical protein